MTDEFQARIAIPAARRIKLGAATAATIAEMLAAIDRPPSAGARGAVAVEANCSFSDAKCITWGIIRWRPREIDRRRVERRQRRMAGSMRSANTARSLAP